MGEQERKRTFDCFIQDEISGDKYSATVVVAKHKVIRQSLQRDGKIDLADIYITSVSSTRGRLHHHFVVQKLNGDGLFMFREAVNNETRRYCNVWDLGPVFGKLATQALRELA
jgi:hypothetical protein